MTMEYDSVPGVEKPISRLVQGTMMVGTSDMDRTRALLDACYEAGINAFDSAYIYGGGDCERALGRWIAERSLREKVVILGKGAHPRDGQSRMTPEFIHAELTESLERLETDCIDLYVLHRDDPNVPVGTIVQALSSHVQAGRIRAWGGSNWTHTRLQAAMKFADAHGLRGPDVSSPHYGLAEQVAPPWDGCVTITGPGNRDARDFYLRTQMPVFAWSSLAGGFFSGRFRRGQLDGFEGRDALCVKSYCTDENFQRLDRVERLAKDRGVSAARIALAYVLSDPMNVFPLIGCWKPEEARDNAAATDIHLTEDERSWLNLERETL